MNEMQREQMDKSNEIIRGIDKRGIPISVDKCVELINEMQIEIDKGFTSFFCTDLMSLKKLAEKEAEHFSNWPITEKTLKLSLSADAAKRYAPESIPTVLKYISLCNKKRHITSLSGIADVAKGFGGRIYPKSNIREDVGRIYVSKFNYCGLPKIFRPIVEAPEGFKFVNFDAKGVELFILAYRSGDHELTQALWSEDFHQKNAIKWGIDREAAKTVSFSILYGGTSKLLAKELGVSQQTAELLITEFSEQFPVAWKWMKDVYDKGIVLGKAVSGYGTERSFGICGEEAGKSAVSHAIQSTAGEAIRLLLPDVERHASDLGGEVTLMVFDCFLVMLPETIGEIEIDLFRSEIESASVKWGYPLFFSSADYGKNWQ